MPATLNTLPVELLLHISANIRTLRNVLRLASCSRRLYDILIPWAYRSIHLKESPRLASGVLRAVLLNPNLAQCVRELDVTLSDPVSFSPCEESGGSDRPMPLPIDPGLLERAVDDASYSTDEKTKWLGDLEKGKPDAYIGLLLVSLAGLKRLSLTSVGDEVYCHKILERASEGKKPFDETGPRFARLVEARVFDIGQSRYFTSNKLIPFLRFPALRSIYATAIFDNDEAWQQQESSNITHLNLTGQVCINGLHGLLPSCKYLKSFEYTHCYPGTQGSFEPKRLYNSLLEVKDTLERLSIKSYQRHQSDYALVGSFAAFTSLKYLEIGVEFLRSTDCHSKLHILLPRSLEALFIDRVNGDCLSWVLQELNTWIDDWAKYTPNFNHLEVDSSDTLTEAQHDEIMVHCQRWGDVLGDHATINWEI
ncbi:hypothetical protein D8B26_000084 [Coccidioides posadasii str. Silveira]|uniref:Leucine-rich repeat domain-containing protein n=3 Tax=Coccidioides TaxID=5500 RepID=E9D7J2_COCPS|nr:hypothetical protein CPC735_067010 [Coccidioides posadasii C735 delta SOWgp]EER25601.1 hypothetical protein CPC735_067010 [Coccidioides posadasii C735 delta SOWgp]EFW17351.1 conserved hypothetical protein [Coccidioides posadasii str. Silveira]KMP05714.1 hypothetical protein CIRG_05395 [Coccidioides immitis RMSCC 2394]QVM05373.1 hypothetical protein D8B26_000084 [Coccidioides posadasii str. Silveira]|eukprot:XP_003067746.1 hypothetical protein CPC735_067010 [Coccidioides posadasii C735 delta SOWgp]